LLDNEEKGEEEIRSRRRTHYYLARAYQELNEHEKAIHNYIIAKNLIPKTNRSYLIPVFDLGATYLDNKSYNECEELYRKLIEEIEEIIKKIPPLRWGEIPGKDSEKLKAYLEKNFDIRGIIDKNFEEIEKGRTIQISTETNCLFLCLNQEESWATLVIDDGRIDKLKAAKYNSEVNIYLPIEFNASSELADSEFGYNDVTLGFLMGLACLNLAFCYSKRDMNLTDALKLVEKANSYIIYLQNTERKHQSEERYAHHKGWILYKQAKLGDGVSDMKAAIDCLKQAVCMKADPDYYLHLALALEHKLDTEGGDLQKTETGKNEMKCNLVLALACCDHAIDLDMQNELTEQATNLKKRLEDLKRNSLNKPDAKKAKESAEQSKGYA
jgi:tetratricopeptide (TPR) repeat protein